MSSKASELTTRMDCFQPREADHTFDSHIGSSREQRQNVDNTSGGIEEEMDVSFIIIEDI
jgi:hypothetical protein